MYTPETPCMKGTSVDIKDTWINQLCNLKAPFVSASKMAGEIRATLAYSLKLRQHRQVALSRLVVMFAEHVVTKVLKTKTDFTITEIRVFRQISCKCWTLQCIGVLCLKDKTVRCSCCCILEEEERWMTDPWSLTETQSSNPSTVERPCTADIPTENQAKDMS